MPTTLTMEQLAEVRGLDLGVSERLPVTQEIIDGFADATGDHQWIHVNRARASDGPFGGTIAHGYLTLSLLPTLVGSLLEVSDSTLAVNYGLDRLRLTAAARAGKRVRDNRFGGAEVRRAVGPDRSDGADRGRGPAGTRRPDAHPPLRTWVPVLNEVW